MTESLIIDKIIEIFKKNISVDEVLNWEIVDKDKISKNSSISVIEKRLKRQINDLVLYYGIIGALKKIIDFQSSLNAFEQTSNINLLSMGNKLLYERILGYYPRLFMPI